MTVTDNTTPDVRAWKDQAGPEHPAGVVDLDSLQGGLAIATEGMATAGCCGAETSQWGRTCGNCTQYTC